MPSLPAAYVGGTVTLPAGTVANLLTLIQDQLAANCPGTAVELQISAGAGNSGSIAVGAASQISGPLTQTNFAYKLTPSSPPRIYRSTYPGNSVPLGDIQVFATSTNTLNIEVWT